MKKISFWLAMAVLILGAGYFGLAIGKEKAIGPTLTAVEAKKKWGSSLFDENSFRTGEESIRATMVYDLISSKKFIDKPLSEVIQKLGPSTGYFWNDRIPAYLLNKGWETNSDVWQIVFLPGKNSVVKEIIIGKNCCDTNETPQK